MASPADDMIAALDAFVADPTDATTVGDLYRVTEGFDALTATDKAKVVPAMFRLMERCPDADLGSPGPLVHSIESLGKSLGILTYEALLIDSVRRRPMYLNLWMVNRILNIAPDGPQRTALLALLQDVRDDPKWAGLASNEATHYLKHQAARTAG